LPSGLTVSSRGCITTGDDDNLQWLNRSSYRDQAFEASINQAICLACPAPQNLTSKGLIQLYLSSKHSSAHASSTSTINIHPRTHRRRQQEEWAGTWCFLLFFLPPCALVGCHRACKNSYNSVTQIRPLHMRCVFRLCLVKCLRRTRCGAIRSTW